MEFQGMSPRLMPHGLSFSAWPHRLAWLLACATFPLLFIGGLVTSLGVGLAVPDWPTTFGYNMFLYPWSKMIGGVFYEHSHRLVGSLVGLITIALALTFWFQEKRPWLRWLGVLALGFVIAQGVLGGLRVVLLQQTLAILHACVAQAFFAFTVSLVVLTSNEWRIPVQGAPITDGGRLRRVSALTTLFLYLQIVFGAVLRHSGDMLGGHLIVAFLAAIHIVLLLRRITRGHFDRIALLRPAYFLGILLVLQLMLGVAAYLGKFTALLRWPHDAMVAITTTHLVVGALMLAASVVLTLRAYRLSASKPSLGHAPWLEEQFSS